MEWTPRRPDAGRREALYAGPLRRLEQHCIAMGAVAAEARGRTAFLPLRGLGGTALLRRIAARAAMRTRPRRFDAPAVSRGVMPRRAAGRPPERRVLLCAGAKRAARGETRPPRQKQAVRQDEESHPHRHAAFPSPGKMTGQAFPVAEAPVTPVRQPCRIDPAQSLYWTSTHPVWGCNPRARRIGNSLSHPQQRSRCTWGMEMARRAVLWPSSSRFSPFRLHASQARMSHRDAEFRDTCLSPRCREPGGKRFSRHVARAAMDAPGAGSRVRGASPRACNAAEEGMRVEAFPVHGGTFRLPGRPGRLK
jgi:hypothetical protein